MGWKWGDIAPKDAQAAGVVWGDSQSASAHGAEGEAKALAVICDTQEDYDRLIALLEENAPTA